MTSPSISFNKNVTLTCTNGSIHNFAKGLVYSVVSVDRYETDCDIHLSGDNYALHVPYTNLSLYHLPQVYKPPTEERRCGGCNPQRVPTNNEVYTEPPKPIREAATQAGNFQPEKAMVKTVEKKNRKK